MRLYALQWPGVVNNMSVQQPVGAIATKKSILNNQLDGMDAPIDWKYSFGTEALGVLNQNSDTYDYGASHDGYRLNLAADLASSHANQAGTGDVAFVGMRAVTADGTISFVEANASAMLVAPASVIEGADATIPLTLTLRNAAGTSGTVSFSLDASSTSINGTDVSVPVYSASYSVPASATGDYVITLPTVAVLDNLTAAASKPVAPRPATTATSVIPTNTAAPSAVVVQSGDSIGAGFTASDYVAIDHLGFKGNIAVHNVSVVGITQQAGYDRRETDLFPYLDPRVASVLVIQQGANDLFQGTKGADLYNNVLRPFVASAKAAGFYVVVGTLLPLELGGWTTANDQERLTYNQMVRSNAAGADGINDAASDPMIGEGTHPANSPYYNDGLHPSVTGQQRLAILNAAALAPFLRPPAQSSVVLKVTVSGQTFANGTDTTTATVTLKDNDYVGTPGADMLFGTAVNETFVGSGGQDRIDGGAGFDTLVLSGTRASYQALVAQGETILIGADGVTQVSNIEQVRFADASVSMTQVIAGATTFDGLLYIASYTDLLRAFGNNPAAGVRHYLEFGHAEGRRISFDAREYLASNPDVLRFFGNDPAAALRHYVTYGFREDRSIDSFDARLYLASNLDLVRSIGDNPAAALTHYLDHGIKENRATDSFDAREYLASNLDLLRFYGNDPMAAVQHYIVWGVREGRPVDSFNARLYLASNPDLARSLGDNPAAALTHYLDHGFKENRATNSFDAREYLASNPDVLRFYGNDPVAAVRHYVVFGAREDRSTDSFDGTQYLLANADLIRAFGNDPGAALTHYLTFGVNESRSTSGFDPVGYLLSYSDLQAAGLGAANALRHWMLYGAAEHRMGDTAFGQDQSSHLLAAGSTSHQAIDRAGDLDWFQLNLTAGQHAHVNLSAAFVQRATVHDAAGHLLETYMGNDTHLGIDFTATAAGIYYITVQANNSAVAGAYDIQAIL